MVPQQYDTLGELTKALLAAGGEVAGTRTDDSDRPVGFWVEFDGYTVVVDHPPGSPHTTVGVSFRLTGFLRERRFGEAFLREQFQEAYDATPSEEDLDQFATELAVKKVGTVDSEVWGTVREAVRELRLTSDFYWNELPSDAVNAPDGYRLVEKVFVDDPTFGPSRMHRVLEQVTGEFSPVSRIFQDEVPLLDEENEPSGGDVEPRQSSLRGIQ